MIEDHMPEAVNETELDPLPEPGTEVNVSQAGAGIGKVNFDFLKSNCFRVVHVSGVFGGIAPRAELAVNVYSERPPIPTRISHFVEADGTVGPELLSERRSRDAIIREVEVCLMMDLDTAAALHEWLGRHVDRLRRLKEKAVQK